MSVAYANGKPAVFHTYILAGKTARLYQSCSEFRFDGNAHRNAISRANRFLHWRDMLELKGLGFDTYDWAVWGRLTTPAASTSSRWASAGRA